MLHFRAAEEAIHAVESNGLILGFLPAAVYESKTLLLGENDRFLLYTDGVLEASRNGEEFGQARLQELFRVANTADQICDSVTAAVDHWASGVASDDITVVAMQFDSLPAKPK